MALQIIKDLSRLKNQLLNTGLQQKDNPLWQVINQLIDQIQALTNNALNPGSGGGSSSTIINNDITQVIGLIGETGEIGEIGPVGPKGRIGNRGPRGYIGPPGDCCESNETIIMINNSGFGSSSFVEWSVLTNGDPINPELIFDGLGDVIMIHTP